MRKFAFPIVAAAGFALSPIVAAQTTEQPADTEQAEPAAEPADRRLIGSFRDITAFGGMAELRRVSVRLLTAGDSG